MIFQSAPVEEAPGELRKWDHPLAIPALIGHVVNGHDYGGVAHFRATGVKFAEIDGQDSCVPVGHVNDVGANVGQTHGLDGRSAEEEETGGVVWVVSAVGGINSVAVEKLGLVDK